MSEPVFNYNTEIKEPRKQVQIKKKVTEPGKNHLLHILRQ